MTSTLTIVGFLLICIVSVHMIQKFPGDDINFVCNETPTKWCFMADGGDLNPLPNGILTSGKVATIFNLASNHEGLYYCFNENTIINQFNLTVLAIAKFVNCPLATENCDLGTIYFTEESQTLVFNISLEFYGGGNRNEKQKINYIFLRNPTGTIFVSCSQGANCISPFDNRFSFNNLDKYTVQVSLNNSFVNDSGVYKAEVEVSEGAGIVDSITSVFAINIMSSTVTTSSSTTMIITMTTSTMTSQQVTTTTTTTSIKPSSTTSMTATTSSDATATSSATSITSTTATTSTISTTTTATSYETPDVGGVLAKNTFESGYIVLICVVSLLIILIFIISLVIGICILTKKDGQSKLIVTLKRVSIFNKTENYKLNSLPADTTTDPIQFDNITNDSAAHYSSVYCSTGAEIICTGTGIYAKVNLSNDTVDPLSQTHNSSKHSV